MHFTNGLLFMTMCHHIKIVFAVGKQIQELMRWHEAFLGCKPKYINYLGLRQNTSVDFAVQNKFRIAKQMPGVCLYFRAGLPTKCRADQEILQKMILFEVTVYQKKEFCNQTLS